MECLQEVRLARTTFVFGTRPAALQVSVLWEDVQRADQHTLLPSAHRPGDHHLCRDAGRQRLPYSVDRNHMRRLPAKSASHAHLSRKSHHSTNALVHEVLKRSAQADDVANTCPRMKKQPFWHRLSNRLRRARLSPPNGFTRRLSSVLDTKSMKVRSIGCLSAIGGVK